MDINKLEVYGLANLQDHKSNVYKPQDFSHRLLSDHPSGY